MSTANPREFGLTDDDLRALADAFYPDRDPRRYRLNDDHGTATRAGLIRSRLRALADAVEAQITEHQREALARLGRARRP